jgi:hypothetical protein
MKLGAASSFEKASKPGRGGVRVGTTVRFGGALNIGKIVTGSTKPISASRVALAEANVLDPKSATRW